MLNVIIFLKRKKKLTKKNWLRFLGENFLNIIH